MESLIRDLAAAAGVSALQHGGMILFSHSDADKLLNTARENNVYIWGVEGFRILAGGVEPAMDSILDLSDVNDSKKSISDARTFLLETDPSLFFDFVIAAEPPRRNAGAWD